MTEKTRIINKKEVEVRILNDDNNLMDVEEKYFDFAFMRIEGDLNFGMGIPSFGSTNVEKYTFTTLTSKELEEKFIFI